MKDNLEFMLQRRFVHRGAATLLLIFMWPALALSANLDIKIALDKHAFAAGEPVSGKFIVESSVPSTYMGTFTIKLYKNDEKVREINTNAPIFLGSTEYSFKSFGLSGINSGPEDEGLWKVVILKEGSPQIRAEADFQVGSPDNKEVNSINTK